ncbi:MAG: hypothetical protein E7658_00365 [Ruminococcaceae bacterium]|nr:hypothetical protein [Oscillospiraceae bacterium]
MFKITPIEDKAMQEELCELHNTKYLPADFCYLAANVNDDGSKILGLLGLCQCYFRGESGIIHNVTPFPGTYDEEVIIIMVRTAMSFLYRCGIQDVILDEGACDPVLAKKMGFLPDENGNPAIDLKRFYISPCHYNKDEKDEEK